MVLKLGEIHPPVYHSTKILILLTRVYFISHLVRYRIRIYHQQPTRRQHITAGPLFTMLEVVLIPVTFYNHYEVKSQYIIFPVSVLDGLHNI